MSDENQDRAKLTSLVSQHLIDNPQLKDEELFWKLVEQCKQTITYITAVGKDIDFLISWSSGRTAVYLMIDKVPYGTYVEEPGDGRFHVVRQGIIEHSIKTDADLLASVKTYLFDCWGLPS